jgi:predicted Zn-dependent protease
MISIENNYLIEDGSLSDWSNKTETVRNCELEETGTTRAGRAS